MDITIATWNVNSVKSRLPHLLAWLRRDAPHIVLLQETKCTNDTFPAMEIEELGYNLALHGEKSYNGVAILSKFPLSDIQRGLVHDGVDHQARYIEAVVSLPGKALRVASAYIPNGQTADSDKFQFKLRFLEQLQVHLRKLLSYEEMLIVGGDYNIAPEDCDVYDPKLWEGSVLTHDLVRQGFRRIIHMGIYDAFRVANPDQTKDIYSWWDYRGNGFAADHGLRIDHLLVSPQAADALAGCRIEKEWRALDKASDHAPVLGVFRLP